MRRWAWTFGLVVACNGGGGSEGTGETGLPAIDAVDDSFEAVPFFPVEVILGANDEGSKLKIVDLTEPSGGSSVEKQGARGIVFEANPEFSGLETFEYTVRDEFGSEDTATVEVDVLAAPSVTIDAPSGGTTLADGTTTVEFTVEGCTMALPSQNGDGCHLHFKIDGSGYGNLDGSEGQGWYETGPRALEGLESGEREIELRLVTNDGSDIEFRLASGDYLNDAITVTVPAADP